VVDQIHRAKLLVGEHRIHRCGEQGELKPESKLTGTFVADESVPDVHEVIAAIGEAREEAERCQRGREESKVATG
jgi:hypothetical protein